MCSHIDVGAAVECAAKRMCCQSVTQWFSCQTIWTIVLTNAPSICCSKSHWLQIQGTLTLSAAQFTGWIVYLITLDSPHPSKDATEKIMASVNHIKKTDCTMFMKILFTKCQQRMKKCVNIPGHVSNFLSIMPIFSANSYNNVNVKEIVSSFISIVVDDSPSNCQN